ncbi:hypothetical protein IQ07DRAFT_565495 [Pyrenochaeta sp. DS3sAY3a]|nr:hypothetical protein IQ07DRAFT_565495 [Pyrenochaeta sp. DS3sAY3a]
MPPIKTYVKAIVGGSILCIGGPALVMWVTPSEEEIFKRYNPELQKKALATREQRQKDFESFVGQLKEASKSDKPIWIVQKEMEAKRQLEHEQSVRAEHDAQVADIQKRQAEIRATTK